MGIHRLFGRSNDEDEDEEPDRITYWCTVCGMVFERSSSRIDYSWCTRCGADGIRKVSWPGPERPE